MTTFHDLLREVLHRESRLLVDERVGEYQLRRIVVQRAGGAIWEAWDLYSRGGDVAQPWSLIQMEYVYLHAAELFQPLCDLDGEALWNVITYLQALDEVAKVLERAS